MGCTIKNFHEAFPKDEDTAWLGDRSMWDDPSKCSKKAGELTGKMGNKHNKTKCYRPDGHFHCRSDKTCMGSFVIELG